MVFDLVPPFMYTTAIVQLFKKLRKKVSHTGSANIFFKVLRYKVVTSALFIVTYAKTIDTCKTRHALWF